MENLQKQIEELKNEITELKNARDLDHNKLMFYEFSKQFPKELKINGYSPITDVTAYGSNLQRTITITATPQSFTVPENPVDSAIITANDGNQYRILLYSLT